MGQLRRAIVTVRYECAYVEDLLQDFIVQLEAANRQQLKRLSEVAPNKFKMLKDSIEDVWDDMR